MAHDRIETRTDVMMGKPVIAGTRVTVEQILRECALGLTPVQISDQYPGVKPADVASALAFAADYLSYEATVAFAHGR
jgi:uncharacterized protein (DUF433 family)